MIEAADKKEANNHNKCVSAAIGLCFVHILSIAGMTYQIGEVCGPHNAI